MPIEVLYRLLFLTLALAFLVVRNGYRMHVLHGLGTRVIRESWASRFIGGLVIGVGWFFSSAYLLVPNWPAWAYCVTYPVWVRTLGAVTTGGAVVLLAWAHRHLGLNYFPLVSLHSEQTLVMGGPYRWIQHPMYSAFLLFDIGCGCLAANLALTLLVPTLLAIHIALRVGQEEQMLKEHFGPAYQAYAQKTPRFFPDLTFGD